MISIDGILTFIKAAELGSFSAAGQMLRLSAAVVSHRIMMLENQLGCRLFVRTTRKVQLTDQGKLFYDRCLEVRDALERAEATVSDQGAELRGVIKVTAPLGLGRRLVAPMAGTFRAQHPRIELRLRLSDYFVDLLTESVDVAMRIGVLDDSTLIQRKIVDVPRILCASPAYIAQSGEPQTLVDLQAHQCLMLRFPGSRQFRWPFGTEQIVVQGAMDTDDGDVLTDWAINGHGIVLKPTFEVAEHLAAGRLVQVLKDRPPTPASLSLLFPHRNLLPPRVKQFADALHEEARAYVSRQMMLIK